MRNLHISTEHLNISSAIVNEKTLVRIAIGKGGFMVQRNFQLTKDEGGGRRNKERER